MDWILKISDSIRHGKLLTIVKPFLNIIFISGITFSIMNKVYHPVILPNEFNLNEILAYFLQGKFIIPFGIFFLLWAVTSYVFETIFQLFNLGVTEKIRKRLLNYSFIKSFGSYTNEEEKNKVLELAMIPKKDWAVRIYEGIRKEFGDTKLKEINIRLKQAQTDYTSDFILLLRSIIAIVIYFCQVPEFGLLLFVSLLVIQIVMAILLVFGYQLSVILPIVALKYHREYEQYKRQEQLINPDLSK